MDTTLLEFETQFVERLWGGHGLRALYGLPTPEDKPIGEAWLVSDHLFAESVIMTGSLAGLTLHELIQRDTAAVLGTHARLTHGGRFPLLLKLIDAAEVLSVQVHPDDATAARLGEDDIGKTEMWHVLHTEPGSALYCGLAPGTTREAIADAIPDNTLDRLLTRFEVAPGDSIHVPAGTVHAIGAGVILAEIQQNSDITYRLYDWGRVQADGTPRTLHVDKALESIDLTSDTRQPSTPLAYELGGARIDVLAACRYFAAERLTLGGTARRMTNGLSFHILLCCEGSITASTERGSATLSPGTCALVCGCEMEYDITGQGCVLDYYVPDIQHNIVEPLARAGYSATAIERLDIG